MEHNMKLYTSKVAYHYDINCLQKLFPLFSSSESSNKPKQNTATYATEIIVFSILLCELQKYARH